MEAALREKIIKLVSSGHDSEAVLDNLGISAEALDDPELRAAIKEAHRIATARLRSKIMQLALDSDDSRSLLQLLERREAMVTDEPVTVVRMIVVDSPCPHCGKFPGTKLARPVIQEAEGGNGKEPHERHLNINQEATP